MGDTVASDAAAVEHARPHCTDFAGSGALLSTQGCRRRLSFVPQRENWDCGLACCEMVLRACGVRASGVMDAPRSTVWTIDLLLALHGALSPKRAAAALTFTTTCAGAPPPTHFDLPFYQKAPGDAERVPLAFAEARARGLTVREEMADLGRVAADLAAGAALFIALVDYRILRCDACGCGGGRGGAPSYQGHYIVLTGCVGGILQYHDPGRAAPSADCCRVGVAAFSEAFTAAGTDADLIRVALN